MHNVVDMTYGITEKDFSSQVEHLLYLFGWRWCHFRVAFSNKGWRTPIKGNKGFPDIVAVRPPTPRLLFIELKSEKGKLSIPQVEWLELLKQCKGVEVYCWKPSQFEEIASILC